jgi:hypothetical protein
MARVLLGAAVSSLLLGLLPSDASAQSPAPAAELPACSEPMIAGTWQALFENPYLGFTLACSLSVSATGVISDGACDIGSFTHGGWTLTQPPWGTLTINRACKVIGAISYTVCSPSPCGNPATSMTIQNQNRLCSGDPETAAGFQDSCSGSPDKASPKFIGWI